MRVLPCSSLLLLATACQSLPGSTPHEIVHDTHSFSHPNRVRVTHASLDLALDFQAREARGTVELSIERPDGTAPLELDVHALAIEEVTAASGTPLQWK